MTVRYDPPKEEELELEAASVATASNDAVSLDVNDIENMKERRKDRIDDKDKDPTIGSTGSPMPDAVYVKTASIPSLSSVPRPASSSIA